MKMTEEEFSNFLASNPSYTFDEQKGKVRKKTKEELLEKSDEGEMPETKKKKNKYRNIKVYEYESGLASVEKDLKDNGKIIAVFDSKKEFMRWNELRNLETAGEISELQRQIPLLIQEAFKYEGKKIAAIKYQADFIYVRNGRKIIEDVKPLDKKTKKYKTTKDFNLKWKLLKYKYPEYLFELF